jgi:glyoxylase-like metal-dependent hydrolase (beta-lactamase superfamily II)
MFNLASRQDELELVYPFWILRNGKTTTLIDTGFSSQMAQARGVFDFRSAGDVLAELGVDPSEIRSIVISHLHYDHFSVPQRYPNAVFYIQSDDIDYFTGRGRAHPAFHSADPEAIDQIADLRAAGRIQSMSGDFSVGGIDVLHVGGHTPGHQISVIELGGKPLVFACDASHFYANLETRTPTSIIHNYDNYQRGFSTIATLAAKGRWFPGHDPKMLEQLDRVSDNVYRVRDN